MDGEGLLMNKTEARRKYVLLENTEVYRVGESPRRRRRGTDWVFLSLWGVILVSCLMVLGGVAWLLWQAISAVGRLVHG
jgi:hypothetical protein